MNLKNVKLSCFGPSPKIEKPVSDSTHSVEKRSSLTYPSGGMGMQKKARTPTPTGVRVLPRKAL